MYILLISYSHVHTLYCCTSCNLYRHKFCTSYNLYKIPTCTRHIHIKIKCKTWLRSLMTMSPGVVSVHHIYQVLITMHFDALLSATSLSARHNLTRPCATSFHSTFLHQYIMILKGGNCLAE